MSQFIEFRDALTKVIEIAQGSSTSSPDSSSGSQREPRVFISRPIPADVNKVIDCDGDIWERDMTSDRRTWSTQGYEGALEHIVWKYAPLTEVIS